MAKKKELHFEALKYNNKIVLNRFVNLIYLEILKC